MICDTLDTVGSGTSMWTLTLSCVGRALGTLPVTGQDEGEALGVEVWGGELQEGEETTGPRAAASPWPREAGGQLREETRVGTGRGGAAQWAELVDSTAGNIRRDQRKKSALRGGVRWEQAKRTCEQTLRCHGVPAG